jgi:hypothetical protein
MADRELALDLEPDHQEEERQQAVIDPVQQRHAEALAAQRDAELLLPERGKGWPERRVGQRHRQQRREQQQHARRRPPARELERGRAHPMPEPPQHRVGQRACVPRAVVEAAVDEEGRRDPHAARARAALVRLQARPRPRGGLRGIVVSQAEIALDRPQVVLGQRLRARHQLEMRPPEPVRVGGALDQLGGAPGELAAADRPVAEDIAQPIAELVADLGDLLVGRPAVGAAVAAVLDQRDLGVGGAKHMVVGLVHRTIEPIVQPGSRHPVPRLASALMIGLQPHPRRPATRRAA